MVKKAKDEDVVNAFLSARNRPFSLQQIVDGLQSKGLKKTACERALNVLVENGNVTLKEFGKAKIFLCRQDSIEIPDEQEMLQMDSEITHKAHELKQLTEKRQVLEKQISALNTAISLSDAISKCDQLSEEIAESKRKLDAMGPESEQVTEEEKKRVEDQYKKMRVWHAPNLTPASMDDHSCSAFTFLPFAAMTSRKNGPAGRGLLRIYSMEFLKEAGRNRRSSWKRSDSKWMRNRTPRWPNFQRSMNQTNEMASANTAVPTMARTN
uniref:Homologous-pairing protein 2 winged helix domain-containing protein n=1 Tax=Rhodosorus marinus TaxID=101924 RepID=A0A7S3EN79_9RHOD|mmetsp:Transcript_45680/g.177866  ORF Transcript_45680/g.177866 Transcript_45680/m.177866 type:complete len:267 (+) Transcript_45680:334-1134(+)